MSVWTDHRPVPPLVFLLLPDGAAWIPADRWRLDELPGGRPVLWGDVDDGSLPRGRALKRALAREVSVTRLRLGGETGAIHRPAAGSASRGGAVRSQARRWLAPGMLVEVGGIGSGSLLDAVLGDAGLEPVGSPRAAAGGGLLQFARRDRTESVVLRVGLVGERSDPRRAAEGLTRIDRVTGVPAPRLLAMGTTGPASWSVESRIAGRPPQRSSHATSADVLDALESLPRSERPVSSVGDDLADIAAAFPHHRERVEQRAAAVDDVMRHERGVFAHGDLWPGNLLVRRGHLEGVIDWGSWRSAAPPGVDLLQLCAAAEHRREPLGTAWRRRPWRTGNTASLLRAHLERGGVRSDAKYLDGLGTAWWASKVAGTLERFPERANDASWTAANVDRVIEAATE